MKIKEWIIFGLVVFLSTASMGLGAESGNSSLQESFSQLEKAIQSAKASSGHSDHGSGSRWPQIEHFQMSIWRAMALDPSAIAPVPIKDVPKNLFAAELNQDLTAQLEEIKKSALPKELSVEAEFSQYLTVVQSIINLRLSRQFPQARAVAKRGLLDAQFEPIAAKLTESSKNPSKEGARDAWGDLEDQIKNLKDQVAAKDGSKKEVFNGNSFIWFAVIAIFGFVVGVLVVRLSPGFFPKIFENMDSAVPSATTHSGGTQKLDYARWLREFEEILSRLKSSQLSHERRIEDLVGTSERVAQQLISLSSDARIKNEANLEYRFSSIIKGLQGQLDLGQKLQGGDRVQINVMLEHCLKLCDAIEAGSIHYDRNRPSDPPAMKSA